MRNLVIAAFAVVAGACATTKGLSNKVSDADLGRLSPDQMQPIHQSRQDVFRAQEDLNRAKLALQQARQEDPVAKADLASADADLKQADAQKKIADETRHPDDLNRARDANETAQLHKRAADAHAEYVSKMISFRQAEVDAAQRGVNVAEGKLELAKLQSLQQANIPSATKYDGPAMQKNVNDAETSFTQAQQKAQTLQAQAAAAQSMFQNLRQQYQARAGGPQRG